MSLQYLTKAVSRWLTFSARVFTLQGLAAELADARLGFVHTHHARRRQVRFRSSTFATNRSLIAHSDLAPFDLPSDGGMSHIDSARHWLYAQSNVAQCLHPMHPASKVKLQGKEGAQLVNHRPVWIFWMIQQMSRSVFARLPCLSLLPRPDVLFLDDVLLSQSTPAVRAQPGVDRVPDRHPRGLCPAPSVPAQPVPVRRCVAPLPIPSPSFSAGF